MDDTCYLKSSPWVCSLLFCTCHFLNQRACLLNQPSIHQARADPQAVSSFAKDVTRNDKTLVQTQNINVGSIQVYPHLSCFMGAKMNEEGCRIHVQLILNYNFRDRETPIPAITASH